MRRYFLLIIGMLFSVNSYAGTVSVQPFLTSQDVSISHLESQRTTFSNCLNGNIEGGINIKAGSLVSADFSNAVSPVTRWDESFTDFVVSGMLAPTSASLSSTTTAGTAYTDGFRVVIGATAHTYSASKDTYVYVHSGGYYVYMEVSNGAVQPSTPANTQILFKAVSSGTAITSVTDLRQLGISLTSSVNIVPINYRDGLPMTADGVTAITVQPGSCDVNSTRVVKTTVTALSVATPGDFASGSRATSTYGYVGIDISGNLKLATTAPTNSDYALTATLGKKRYASWGGTTYRVLGWFYMNATGSGNVNIYEIGSIREFDVANSNVLNVYGQTSTASATYVDETSAIVHVYTSGGPFYADYNAGIGNSTSGEISMLTLSVDGVGIIGTDRGATGQSSSGTALAVGVDTVYQNNSLAQGTHTIQGRFRTSAGTAYVNQRTIEYEEK